MSDSVAESYDAILYPGPAVKASHPRNLETLATLHGLAPAPVSTARVLEIGCATAGNLLPLAAHHPEARFVGIDLSPRQIEYAQRSATAAGLDNVDLRAVSVGAVDESWGAFDYILCHGVYSWVSDAVQAELMRVFCENLTPTGVVYVSYNVLPGWFMRQAARDLMLLHTATLGDPKERIDQARAILGTLLEVRGEDDSAYTRAFREEIEVADASDDAYIYHEYLEESNEPVYFSEFAKRADAAGLRYLAEADMKHNFATDLVEPIRSQIESLPLLRRQQYLDFLRGRRMRRTLLCRADTAAPEAMDPRRLEGLHVSLTRAEGWEVVAAGEDPVPAAALESLRASHPRARAVSELRATLPGVPRHPPSADADALADPLTHFLWFSLLHGGVEVCVHPPDLAFEVVARPRVSPLVAVESETSGRVTTGFHTGVRLDAMGQLLIGHLDGSCDRDALAGLVATAAAAGEFELEPDPAAPDAPPDPGQAVDRMLERMAMLGLFLD